MHERRKGFSLLEVTMVLAIVALIIAGLLAARSIIRTSQIQAVMGEYQMYNSAIKNFKSKFHGLPGDFAGATTLWGAATACPVGGTVSGSATCNGDGNGTIDMNTTRYENLLAWRHLGLSGCIGQNFTGNTFGSSVCGIDVKAGENAPSSKMKGGIWNIGVNTAGTAYTTGAPGNQYFPINACTNMLNLHALWLGGGLQDDNAQADSCAHSQIPIFTGQEAYEVDAKFDDKRAASGKIRNQYNNTATYSTCEDSSSTYGGFRTNATGTNCSLVFLIDP